MQIYKFFTINYIPFRSHILLLVWLMRSYVVVEFNHLNIKLYRSKSKV